MHQMKRLVKTNPRQIIEEYVGFEEAQALTVQCLKATHQARLDEGEWAMAWHLTTLRDPLQKVRFGGTEKELETIASYARSVAELETRMQKERKGHKEEEPADGATEQRRPPKGKGGRKGQAAEPQ